MTISAIITAYNSECYLAEAIQSVLRQTRPPEELIVVDDGSTDRTIEVAKSFKEVRYLRKENGGIGSARNFGVEAARGDYLAFLDSDDLWIEAKLADQLSQLESSEAQGVFGHVQEFVCPKLSAEEASKIRFESKPQAARSAGNLLITRDCFEAVGAFSEELKMGEFLDWVCRANDRAIKFGMLDKVVLLRRLHKTNYGRENVQERGGYARLLKAALDRRRAARAATE